MSGGWLTHGVGYCCIDKARALAGQPVPSVPPREFTTLPCIAAGSRQIWMICALSTHPLVSSVKRAFGSTLCRFCSPNSVVTARPICKSGDKRAGQFLLLLASLQEKGGKP